MSILHGVQISSLSYLFNHWTPHIIETFPRKELRGAIEAKAMTMDDVYAELGELVNGTKSGRENDEELIVVDLTGTGAQDAAIGQVRTPLKSSSCAFWTCSQ